MGWLEGIKWYLLYIYILVMIRHICYILKKKLSYIAPKIYIYTECFDDRTTKLNKCVGVEVRWLNWMLKNSRWGLLHTWQHMLSWRGIKSTRQLVLTKGWPLSLSTLNAATPSCLLHKKLYSAFSLFPFPTGVSVLDSLLKTKTSIISLY